MIKYYIYVDGEKTKTENICSTDNEAIIWFAYILKSHSTIEMKKRSLVSENDRVVAGKCLKEINLILYHSVNFKNNNELLKKELKIPEVMKDENF